MFSSLENGYLVVLFTGHLPETRAGAADHGEGRVGAARVVRAEGRQPKS